MNTANLKKYGPRARRDFIEAVQARAAYYGLTKGEVLPLKVDGEAAIIGDQHFPASIAGKRKKLEERIKTEGFDQVIDAIAYTWFNRLVAIRYMELHGYLDHGYRVLSHPEGDANPEILAHAEHLDLPGLANDTVVDLKLAGDKDAELYRLLLIAQCNALSRAMPFLFERIDDESELLLPENLLKSDSLVRRLVSDIPEEEWQDIEVIGWLYQFYVADEKSRIDKYSKKQPVKSRDIPSKTQLFTPNWIVKYMVENSLGAKWVASYPDSSLRERMEYYTVPAKQNDKALAEQETTTPNKLNPEELTFMDPACGSGHILVEAYELFKAIYLEQGYRQRDAVKLILEKNLFGLEIDPRASQLTGFALMMKGRADDRQLFERKPQLNIVSLRDSRGFDPHKLEKRINLAKYGLRLSDLLDLAQVFEHATVFGSLIELPAGLHGALSALRQLSESVADDLFILDPLRHLKQLVLQAEMLVTKYKVVVLNPPYLGSRGMNSLVKGFMKKNFPDSSTNLFACFMERGFSFTESGHDTAMVTMQSWMFLSSLGALRERVLEEKTIVTMAHLGARAFGSISGEVVQTTAFVLRDAKPEGHRGVFFRLLDGGEEEKAQSLANGEHRFDTVPQSNFKKIPGSPLAYWVSDAFRQIFKKGRPLAEISEALRGVETGANERFLRHWYETDRSKLGVSCTDSTTGHTWFPYNKGGAFRKWYGNRTLVVNWRDGGHDIKNQAYPKGGRLPWRAANEKRYFDDGLTWGGLTSGAVTFRKCDYGAVFDSNKGSMMFPESSQLPSILALLNSTLVAECLAVLNPTISTQKDDIGNVPVIDAVFNERNRLDDLVAQCVELAKNDERSLETSWDFERLPIVPDPNTESSLERSYEEWVEQSRDVVGKMRRLEELNNILFLEIYGLIGEFSPDVPTEEITLSRNPAYRYGADFSDDRAWRCFARDAMQEVISYAVGCMMGRYSLDRPGLVYAASGSIGFMPTHYVAFLADDDGIVPLTDTDWFDDDATHRVEEFLRVVWGDSQLEENLEFLARHLGQRKGEGGREAIRAYMSDSFYADHCKTYSVTGGGKRPIYWLFSSGPNKALECLVYLHRYNEGTLSRMRTEYVIPLQGKVASRISQLADDIGAATSTSHRRKLQKRHDVLVKHREELRLFDEKLRHYADQRIHLDLDDGVKVNYGKFGDLLAKVKEITGKKPEAV